MVCCDVRLKVLFLEGIKKKHQQNYEIESTHKKCYRLWFAYMRRAMVRAMHAHGTMLSMKANPIEQLSFGGV